MGVAPANQHIRERVAVLNHPSNPTSTAWDESATRRLAELGFTSVQVNLAWGWRPADEPLNLEDVVALDGEDAAAYAQPLPLGSDPERLDQRRRELAHRIDLCHAEGLRTIFHCGAPYNQQRMHGDAPPNCLMDESVIRRYELLLAALQRDFRVDDLWLYTYDQDAWLCSEFSTCPRCQGIPLHQRLIPFLERLAAQWATLSPEGRLWWEPWELSAGQVLEVLGRVSPAGFGLAVHNNIAECMVAFAGDRHVANFARVAASRGVPVTIEGFLGAASEEVEPYLALQSPLTTARQVRAMMGIDGVTGIKEYYGLDLSKEDPNLEAAALVMQDPTITDDEILGRLSEGYGDSATRTTVEAVWRQASEAMELYPWDASWLAREVGRSDPRHSLNAACVRGPDVETPSWRSTRGATFMVIGDKEPHPWLLEDVQLRWELCAEKQTEAIELAESVVGTLPPAQQKAFAAFIDELREFRRRVRAYAYHCRETNLARLLRQSTTVTQEKRQQLIDELLDVMRADQQNNGGDDLDAAIEMLEHDPAGFAGTYFLPTAAAERTYHSHGQTTTFTAFEAPRGFFSVTSR